MVPPKPPSRQGRFAFFRYLRNFRRDILSANPERLYRAKMAEFRIPFLHTFLVNEPVLWKRVLTEAPGDFPKSPRMAAGLEPLLGQGVFLTNGALWQRQRRIIDPAFEGGRLRDTFPAIWAAGEATVARLRARAGGAPVEVEAEMSHSTADVIFRTLFSVPIEDRTASAVFGAFRAYQGTQPLINLAAFLPLPRWMPRFHRRATLRAARRIRGLIGDLVAARRRAIAEGRAPDDLATKIMTMADPLDGRPFDDAEMVDQVAVFFLAGHETSASALGWALYLLALDPDLQDRLAEEAASELTPDFGSVSRLRLARDVFREALRLYPPVPMMVREAACPAEFRGRRVETGAQVVVSPWHLGRHQAIWEDPDAFCPARWQTPEGRASARDGFIPFSAGPRVCTGAGLAMVEGPLILAMIARDLRLAPVEGRVPVPQAQLTVRAAEGIWLHLTPRS
ncbi:cytochrome P450 [Pararhodobacter aggregans]|uniref:Cytochrome P450 n=1 Tax=Pararhodobacter aggregans TaxID=404875 RepID=A0A2T7URF7_9RHOB|nr:cytochrome P450 [Pararhodobacter aggregans]PVE47267.1 cytochrome P450 [Pararhodobacter aggregans]